MNRLLSWLESLPRWHAIVVALIFLLTGLFSAAFLIYNHFAKTQDVQGLEVRMATKLDTKLSELGSKVSSQFKDLDQRLGGVSLELEMLRLEVEQANLRHEELRLEGVRKQNGRLLLEEQRQVEKVTGSLNRLEERLGDLYDRMRKERLKAGPA